MVIGLFILWGTIVNRTYGAHKTLYISLFLPRIIAPIYVVPRNSVFLQSVLSDFVIIFLSDFVIIFLSDFVITGGHSN